MPQPNRQQLINQRREAVSRAYPALWSQMIADWAAPGDQDCAWLLYSANYLLRTAGVRWAIDPLALASRVPGAPKMDASRDLAGLSFVVLTHAHADHLDRDLIRQMQYLPVQWIIPQAVWSILRSQLDIDLNRVIIPRSLVPINIQGVRLVPFDGLHWEPKPPGAAESWRPHGVPAMGYLVELSGKRWLFPGDTRDYRASRLPRFGPVNGLFAHVWLGRGCAQLDPPPLVEPFVNFMVGLKPGAIVATHLHEFGRDADDYWGDDHFQCVSRQLQAVAPHIQVSSAKIGEKVIL
jgi:hypothetical protein